MTIAIVHRRRAWLPTLNLLFAGGAAVLGVIAIASDDVSSSTPAPVPPPVVVRDANDTSADVIGAAGDECGEQIRGDRPYPC